MNPDLSPAPVQVWDFIALLPVLVYLFADYLSRRRRIRRELKAERFFEDPQKPQLSREIK